MKKLKNHANYEEYVKFQAQKTSDPNRIKIWTKRFPKHVEIFKNKFRYISLIRGSGVLCTGARSGAECQALEDMDMVAVGIDIVPCPPLVVKGDFHKLDFNDFAFDAYYTNALDHSNNIEKLISEAIRVLKKGGTLILELQLGLISTYEETQINDVIELRWLVERTGQMEFISETEMTGKERMQSKGKEILCQWLKK